jgi:hypothetical protein
LFQMNEVEVRSSGARRMCALFSTADARYHVWFDPTTMQPIDGVLFKNALPNAPRHEQRVRRLDATNAKNAPIVAALLQLVIDRRLVEATTAQAQADEALEQRELRVMTFVKESWAARMAGTRAPDLPHDISAEVFNEASKALGKKLFSGDSR